MWDFGYVNTRLGELDLYMKAQMNLIKDWCLNH
jgi:hypothetical protein